MLGSVKIFHQPVAPIWSGASSESRKSPSVGISHSTPMNSEQQVERRLGERPGGGRGHQASLLKLRMLSSRIGITSRNRKTAIADPRPKSFTPPNEVRHIASAITFASS